MIIPIFEELENDNSIENGLNLWVVSDNLRKGAALNTIQIAAVSYTHLTLPTKRIV